MKPLLPAVLSALLSFTADAAPRIVCHTHYNGESQAHVAQPVATPYGVEQCSQLNANPLVNPRHSR